MKKILYILGMAAGLSAVSCTMEEQYEVPAAVKGHKITLTGETYSQTKVSIGEKDGEKYPLLWSEGDAIAIYSKDYSVTPGEGEGAEDVITGNIKGETAELFAGDAGKASGVFQTTNEFALEADEQVLITYPASNVKFAAGKMTAKVTTYQEQRKANSSSHVGNYAVAYGETTLKANQKEDVNFTLAQKTAFVKLVLSTTAYSNLKLVGAKLSAPGTPLSGNVEIDLATGALTSSNTFDYVGAKYREPVAFSETQSLYFTALPCDLTGKEVFVIITMMDGTKTVTIPAKIQGGKLEASCLTVINISNISKDTNSYEWYEPVETRDLVDAWAFGPQNTYYVECKAAGAGDTELKIDVKARGDISRITGAPKYYGIICHSGSGNNKFLKLPNGVDKYEAQPTSLVNSDWTIDVIAYDQTNKNGSWGVVAIYDENYNILWSYMICKYNTGDEIKEIAYPGTDIVLMDRALGVVGGQKTTSEGTWKFSGECALFQWGRKDPFMWSNSGLSHYDMKFPPADADVTTAIQHPYRVYAYTNGTDGDWQRKEHRTDLWGGVNNTTDWYDPNGVGHKTIYDPCPAGWRVPDARVLAEVQAKAEIWETMIKGNNGAIANNESEKTALQKIEWVKSDAPFYGNFSALAYPLGGGQYDYWPYYGCRFGDKENWGNRTGRSDRVGALYWANSVDPVGLLSAAKIEYCYFSSAEGHGTTNLANRAQSYAVRCQKDTENR